MIDVNVKTSKDDSKGLVKAIFIVIVPEVSQFSFYLAGKIFTWRGYRTEYNVVVSSMTKFFTLALNAHNFHHRLK